MAVSTVRKKPSKCNSFGGFLFADASRSVSSKEMCIAAKGMGDADASRRVSSCFQRWDTLEVFLNNLIQQCLLIIHF
jgi:hypothetical protein